MRRNVTTKTLNDPRHTTQPHREAKSVQIDVYRAQRNTSLTTKGTQTCDYNTMYRNLVVSCVSFSVFLFNV